MGTNYYLRKKTNEPWTLPISRFSEAAEKLCLKTITSGESVFALDTAQCATSVEELHIGKSSFGWHFALCIYPYLGIYGLEDWKKLFESSNYVIVDEEKQTITTEEMIDIIIDRKTPLYLKLREDYEANVEEELKRQGYASYDTALAENHAERGLNGLWAHKSTLVDLRNIKGWEDYSPIIFNYIRTEGTYDLTLDRDFS